MIDCSVVLTCREGAITAAPFFMSLDIRHTQPEAAIRVAMRFSDGVVAEPELLDDPGGDFCTAEHLGTTKPDPFRPSMWGWESGNDLLKAASVAADLTR